MSTSPIGSYQSSLSVSWQTVTRTSSTGVDADSDRDGSTAGNTQGDIVTISKQSITLFQTQHDDGAQGSGHHRHHKLTDAQAFQIGTRIQAKNADLFKQLDQNGDGKLTANELKSGMEKLRQLAQQQDTSATSQGAAPDTSALDTIHQAFQDVLGAGKGHSHHPHLTDEHASQVGASIQKQSAALFKQLDQDGDGKLSAHELKAGLEKLSEQAQQQGITPTSQSASHDATALVTIRQAFQDVLGTGSTQKST